MYLVLFFKQLKECLFAFCPQIFQFGDFDPLVY